MKKPVLTVFAILVQLALLTSIQAQKQSNYWYFGYYAGLNFNTDPPTALTDGKIATQEGCATMSDKNGNLQFYTDGATLYNKNHVAMANGTGLMGNASSTQALIVPDPGNSNRYYVFSMAPYSNSKLYYSIVDMTLDAGNGNVTSEKNVLVLDLTIEGVCAIDGAGFYWILAHKKAVNSYYAYKLTSSGIDLNNPVITSIGVPSLAQGDIGYFKTNVAGNRTALACYNKSRVEVLSFDKITGVYSNLITFTGLSAAYAVEFSPNGKILYATGGSSIYQYNLDAGNASAISASRVTISAGRGEQAMQLAPNGKIYVATSNGTSLGVISNPNVVGTDCGYSAASVSLNGKTSSVGFPNFIASLVGAGSPQLSALSSSAIAATSATIAANITTDGGLTITERGFYFGTSPLPVTNQTIVPGTTGSLTANMSNLSPGTTYYYRAYAINAQGTTYTADSSFTTLNASLPISFSKFTVEKLITSAVLHWNTAQEQNSSSFIIERSSDGNAYESIGKVKAAGNASVTTNYSFTDVTPVTGKSYYRVKQVDLDGNTTYSTIVTLSYEMKAWSFQIIQNPVQNAVQMNMQLTGDKKVYLEVRNAEGVILIKEEELLTKGINRFSIPVSKLSKGIYFIKASIDGVSKTQRFVKQ